MTAMTAMHRNTTFQSDSQPAKTNGHSPNIGMTAEWHRRTFLLILHPFLLILVTQTFPTKLVGGRSFNRFVKCQDLSKERIRESLQSMLCPRLFVDKPLENLYEDLRSFSLKFYHVTCQNMDFLGPQQLNIFIMYQCFAHDVDNLMIFVIKFMSCYLKIQVACDCIMRSDNSWQLLSITMPILKLLTFAVLEEVFLSATHSIKTLPKFKRWTPFQLGPGFLTNPTPSRDLSRPTQMVSCLGSCWGFPGKWIPMSEIPTDLCKSRVDSSSSEATAIVVHGIDVGTGSQEPLHGGVMAFPHRATQWRPTSGTRREMRFLLCCEARCWKLVKERFVLPCQFE